MHFFTKTFPDSIRLKSAHFVILNEYGIEDGDLEYLVLLKSAGDHWDSFSSFIRSILPNLSYDIELISTSNPLFENGINWFHQRKIGKFEQTYECQIIHPSSDDKKAYIMEAPLEKVVSWDEGDWYFLYGWFVID